MKLDHLSPSSLNRWLASREAWYLQYAVGVRTSGPHAWRGTAVERALLTAIQADHSAEECATEALVQFDLEATRHAELCPDEESGKVGELGAEIPYIVKGALPQVREMLAKRGGIAATQVKIEQDYGIGIPLIGYADVITGDGTVVDLKTVAAMPSGIATVKRAHIRQVAFYQPDCAKPAALLYISRPPKAKATHNGVRWIEIEDDYRTAALADLRRAAKAVMAAMKMDDGDLRAIMSPDFDSYYWNSITKARALEVWP